MSKFDSYETDVDEVLQQEPDPGPVRVIVEGTVTTQAAPAIDGDAYSVTIPTSGDVEELAVADPRRSCMVVTSATAFRLATSKDAIRSSSSALWPANEPLIIRHRAAVWVRSTTADQVISTSVERWAD